MADYDWSPPEDTDRKYLTKRLNKLEAEARSIRGLIQRYDRLRERSDELSALKMRTGKR